MPAIRVTLHRRDAEPLSAEFAYDERDLPKEIADQRVTVSVGEGSAHADATVPLDILTLLMGRVMAKAGSQPPKGVVMPKPPSIIMPS